MEGGQRLGRDWVEARLSRLVEARIDRGWVAEQRLGRGWVAEQRLGRG